MSNGLAVRQSAEIQHAPRTFSFAEMQEMAEAVAKSGLFKMNGPQVLTLMLLSESLGLHPVQAVMRYHVFDGKVTMRSDTMLAEFQKAGGRVEWTKDTLTECAAIFSHDVHCPKGQLVSFTMADAKLAALDGKQNWRNHPRPMMRSKVITNGIRMVLPGVIMGIYTEDELEPAETPTVIEATARNTLVGQLKSKLAKPAPVVHEPEVVQTPVIETVAALKQHSDATKAAMSEPTSEWGKWIAESVEAFNHELDKMADKHPEDMRFRQHVRAQQVANHIINEGVADGSIEKAAIETGGKRDNKKVAAILQSIWDTDPGDLMTSASDYLAAKVIPAEAPEPGSDG